MAEGFPGRPSTTHVGKIDDAFVLDIRIFRRSGAIQPGRVTQGLLRGAQGGFGGADIKWTLDLKNPLYGRLTATGEVLGRRVDQTVEVVSSPCRYGGRRYWLVCQSSRARACALALSGGQFVCRAAARLSYACQSESGLYRLARAARKAKASLVRRRRLFRPLWTDPASPSRMASTRASTAGCGMSCSTRRSSGLCPTPARCWRTGGVTTTSSGPTRSSAG